MAPRNVTVEIYEPRSSVRGGGPNRLDSISIDCNVTALVVSETVPGGFAGAIVGIERRVRRRIWGGFAGTRDVQDWSEVIIKSHGRVIHEGAVTIRDTEDGGMTTGFTTDGYYRQALHDIWLNVPNTDVQAKSGVAWIREALSVGAPLVEPAGGIYFQDAGNIYEAREFDGKYPDQIIDQVVKDGAQAGAILDAMIFENRRLRMIPRIPPPTPKYRQPFEHGVTKIQYQSSNMIGGAAVQFTPFAGGPQVTNYFEIPGFRVKHGGRIRAELIGNSVKSETAALSARQRVVVQRGVPALAATITLSGGRGPLLATGLQQPPELTRVGEWYQIGSEPTLVMCTGKKYDFNTRTLNLQLSNVL